MRALRWINQRSDTEDAGGTWKYKLVVVMIVALFLTAGRQLFTPVLPLYVAELGGSESAVGIVVATLTLVSILVRPWVGRFLDRKGRRPILLMATFFTGVAGFLYPLAASVGTLVLVRIVHGVGWSGVGPAASTMAADLIPPAKRAEGLGYFGLSRSLGAAIGPALGILLAQQVGFSAAFLVGAAFSILALIITLRISDNYTPEVDTAPTSKPSLEGLYEPSAVIPSLVIACMTFVSGGLIAFVPLDAVNRDLGNPATFFVIYALFLMLIRPVSGRLSDSGGRGRLLIPGVCIVAAAVLVLGLTGEWWTLSLAAILYAVGFGTVQPIIRALVIDQAPRQRWGAANSTYGTAHDIGSGTGALMLGVLADRWDIPTMFLFSASASGVALLVILARGLHRT